ncbi:hypothetical protein LTR27_011040 [Elasticomyces elasticus]|nr:hypothetical protein LTR27_011040 [Elasticomyces elasticus]
MSTSPSKAATPASDAAAVEKSLFTPKEEAVLKVAWACLKSGPPEIDFEKLVKAYGFNTTKTAQNTWGVIKKKLASITPVLEEPKTPVKPKAKAASPTKKRTKKSEDGDDDDEEKTASPEKKPRKSPVKKTKKSEDGDDDEEKTESPEKKPRKSPVKKTKKAATPVEDEDETSDVKMEGAEAETE